jgi:hypothetical protein
MKGIIIGAVVFILLLIAAVIAILIWVDPQLPFLQKSAYLSISLISVFACGMLIALTAIFAAIAALVAVLRKLTQEKVAPLIDKVNETTDTVRGAVTYVGEGVVSPLVKFAAILAAFRGAIAGLFKR